MPARHRAVHCTDVALPDVGRHIVECARVYLRKAPLALGRPYARHDERIVGHAPRTVLLLPAQLGNDVGQLQQQCRAPLQYRHPDLSFGPLCKECVRVRGSGEGELVGALEGSKDGSKLGSGEACYCARMRACTLVVRACVLSCVPLCVCAVLRACVVLCVLLSVCMHAHARARLLGEAHTHAHTVLGAVLFPLAQSHALLA